MVMRTPDMNPQRMTWRHVALIIFITITATVIKPRALNFFSEEPKKLRAEYIIKDTAGTTVFDITDWSKEKFDSLVNVQMHRE